MFFLFFAKFFKKSVETAVPAETEPRFVLSDPKLGYRNLIFGAPYFGKYYAKINCVHVFRAAFGRTLTGPAGRATLVENVEQK